MKSKTLPFLAASAAALLAPSSLAAYQQPKNMLVEDAVKVARDEAGDKIISLVQPEVADPKESTGESGEPIVRARTDVDDQNEALKTMAAGYAIGTAAGLLIMSPLVIEKIIRDRKCKVEKQKSL